MSAENEINSFYIITSLVGIFVAIAVIFLFTVFNNRKNKLIQDNLEAALNNQKRQHELELKALRGQMNPHFVHILLTLYSIIFNVTMLKHQRIISQNFQN